MDDKILIEADEGQLDLLQTIRIPKNMNYLTERLPKPNYSPMKSKKIDKNRFIQTLGLPSIADQQHNDEDENHSTENGNGRLPKIQKRSMPPERGVNHSISVVNRTPERERDRVNESNVRGSNDPSEVGERRPKNGSKYKQPKLNYEE